MPCLPAAAHVRGTRIARLADPACLRRRPAPRPLPGGPQAAGPRPARPPLRGQARRSRAAGRRSPVPDNLLALQDRLLRLLSPAGPAATMSVGQPATPAQYFADLRLVCSLINGAWPHSRNLIIGPGMAEKLGQYIASTGGTVPRRHALCDAPPLDVRPGAALITAAVRILDGSDLLVLGEFLAPARDGARRKSPRGRWLCRYQRAGHDCSGGFRDALEPLINSFQRTDRRSRGPPGTRHSGQFRARERPRARHSRRNRSW